MGPLVQGRRVDTPTSTLRRTRYPPMTDEQFNQIMLLGYLIFLALLTGVIVEMARVWR